MGLRLVWQPCREVEQGPRLPPRSPSAQSVVVMPGRTSGEAKPDHSTFGSGATPNIWVPRPPRSGREPGHLGEPSSWLRASVLEAMTVSVASLETQI